MLTSWTNEDVESILLQLNKQGLPFKHYEFVTNKDGLNRLGSGASANVYEAVRRKNSKKKFAIKVIGFGNKHIDSESFQQEVKFQKRVSLLNDSIVKIYDSIELRVWIEGEHNVVKAEEVYPSDGTELEGDYLHLQFILMEKLIPVLRRDGFKYRLYPSTLGNCEEILKLAYDIGVAIENAHNDNVIHRDIKLENVFYDPEEKKYKLGDFGIAKITGDGMASTIAFTNGYGAPEVVGTLEDKYDYTADIYSFGMMLYVLLNDIRFPESENYHPNLYQYVQGYTPPRPANGPDELAKVVLKMISFNPDERYQSIAEVIGELEGSKFGGKAQYRHEHKNSYLAFGLGFSLVSAVLWKLSFMPDFQMHASILTYIFCTLCFAVNIFALFEIEASLVDFIFLVTGLLWIIVEKQSWWMLLFICVALVCKWMAGTLGMGILLVNLTCQIMIGYHLTVYHFMEYRWLAMMFIMLSCSFLFGYGTVWLRNRKNFLGKWVWLDSWGLMIWFMEMICLIPLILVLGSYNHFSIIREFSSMVMPKMQWMLTWAPLRVGIGILMFATIWYIRETALTLIEKRKIKLQKRKI